MINKMLDRLGFVPKNKFHNLEDICEDIRLLNKNLVEKNTALEKQVKQYQQGIAYKQSELEAITDEKITVMKKYNNQLEELKDLQKQVRILNYELKDYKRKNSKLLQKQGKLKELVQKHANIAEFWKLYSHEVVDRLEMLCFGSVLPRIMRPTTVSQYKSLDKPVKPKTKTDNNGSMYVEVDHG